MLSMLNSHVEDLWFWNLHIKRLPVYAATEQKEWPEIRQEPTPGSGLDRPNLFDEQSSPAALRIPREKFSNTWVTEEELYRNSHLKSREQVYSYNGYHPAEKVRDYGANTGIINYYVVQQIPERYLDKFLPQRMDFLRNMWRMVHFFNHLKTIYLNIYVNHLYLDSIIMETRWTKPYQLGRFIKVGGAGRGINCAHRNSLCVNNTYISFYYPDAAKSRWWGWVLNINQLRMMSCYDR